MRKQSKSCTARGVSLPVDLNERVEKRLVELSPKVKGFSHYMQLLVHWDLQRKEKPDEKAFPFNWPEPLAAGFAE